MKAEKLEAFKTSMLEFLGLSQVSLETVKTVDGATIEIDGDAAFIISSDGDRIPAPDGEYELEGGAEMGVKDGKIVQVEKEVEEETTEEEVTSENPIDMTKEEVEAMIDEKLTALKAELMGEKKEEEVEASAEEAKEEVKEESKAELSKVEELEAKLSALEKEKEELAVKLSAAEEAKPLKGAPSSAAVKPIDLSKLSEKERIYYELQQIK